jgi:hypothetical protein
MKARSFNQVKAREAGRRLAVMRTRGTRAAARQQRRVSLVGGGAKWRITNLPEVLAAMAKWA